MSPLRGPDQIFDSTRDFENVSRTRKIEFVSVAVPLSWGTERSSYSMEGIQQLQIKVTLEARFPLLIQTGPPLNSSGRAARSARLSRLRGILVLPARSCSSDFVRMLTKLISS